MHNEHNQCKYKHISKRILGLVDKLDDFAFNLNLPQRGKY